VVPARATLARQSIVCRRRYRLGLHNFLLLEVHVKQAKELLMCVVPYIVAAGMLYPLAAVIGASWDAGLAY
jgi:hypothetical protein